jgi:PBP1b-binding outer membrane lipoprotein LpoB
MGKLHNVLTAFVISSCLQLAAQDTVAERGHAPHDPFDNQPMPEQFKMPNVPKTARQASCFASFKKDSTMLDVVRKCGVPDNTPEAAFTFCVLLWMTVPL